MRSSFHILQPGELVITNQVVTAYATSHCQTILMEEIQHNNQFFELPKGTPLMVMKHFIDTTTAQNHYHPEQPYFNEVLVFLYDENYYYLLCKHLPRQNASSLLGKHVILHSSLEL